MDAAAGCRDLGALLLQRTAFVGTGWAERRGGGSVLGIRAGVGEGAQGAGGAGGGSSAGGHPTLQTGGAGGGGAVVFEQKPQAHRCDGDMGAIEALLAAYEHSTGG